MKPLIIIPDEKQTTITMTIDDFKKTINDVWEAGYKEGRADKENCTLSPLPYNIKGVSTNKCETPSSICQTEKNISNEIINKRTFDFISGNANNTNVELQGQIENIW